MHEKKKQSLGVPKCGTVSPTYSITATKNYFQMRIRIEFKSSARHFCNQQKWKEHRASRLGRPERDKRKKKKNTHNVLRLRFYLALE